MEGGEEEQEQAEGADSGATPEWLEPIDHTGDAGFEIYAEGLGQLFSRAAWALFSVITDLARVESREWQSVYVEADDLPALMVRWLSELNFRHVTEHKLFSAFEVETVDETRLEARVGGELIDPSRHIAYTEVKAITYHQLEAWGEGNGWRARVILDL